MKQSVSIPLDHIVGIELEEQTVPGDGISPQAVDAARRLLAGQLLDGADATTYAVHLPDLAVTDLPDGFQEQDPFAKLVVAMRGDLRFNGFSFRSTGAAPHNYSPIFLATRLRASQVFGDAVTNFAKSLRLRYRPLAGKPTQQWHKPIGEAGAPTRGNAKIKVSRVRAAGIIN